MRESSESIEREYREKEKLKYFVEAVGALAVRSKGTNNLSKPKGRTRERGRVSRERESFERVSRVSRVSRERDAE